MHYSTLFKPGDKIYVVIFDFSFNIPNSVLFLFLYSFIKEQMKVNFLRAIQWIYLKSLTI